MKITIGSHVTRAVLALLAAAAVHFATFAAARAAEGLEWTDISPFEIRVNVLTKTDLELQNVQQAMHANSVLMQSADLYVAPARWVGFISIEKASKSYFRIGRRDAAMSEKGLRQWVAQVFEDTTPKIERTRAIKPRGGVGRIAYASMDDQDCLFGAGAYALDTTVSGPDDYYDTLVYIAVCGLPRDFAQVVEFLEGVALASQSDNRAAVAARTGTRNKITRRVPESGHATGSGEDEVVQSGSGFVVTEDGHVVTNFHVIEGCTSIRAQHRDQPRQAEIAATDEDDDLALLRLAGVRGAPIARFRGGRGIRSGDDVVGLGFPLRGLLANQANVTVGIVSATAGLQNDTRFLQISAPVQPGNSGGPLFDRSGHVVGVIVAKLDALQVAELTGDIPQNLNFAIKARVARAFLASNGIEVQTAPASERLDAADIAELGRAVTVAVECVEVR